MTTQQRDRGPRDGIFPALRRLRTGLPWCELLICLALASCGDDGAPESESAPSQPESPAPPVENPPPVPAEPPDGSGPDEPEPEPSEPPEPPPGGGEPEPPPVTGNEPAPSPPEAACSARTGPRPNFLILMTDDQERRLASAEYLPVVNARIADEGIRFDRAYVTTSLCCPSRASILTGLYAHNHMVLSNDQPRGGYSVFRDAGFEDRTIAVRLKEAGYDTAFFGKYLNQYPSYTDWPSPLSVPAGWTTWFAAVDVYPKTGPYIQFNYHMALTDGTSRFYGERPEDYFTDVVTAQAESFLEKVCDPFFAFVAYVSPHGPGTPAPRHAAAQVNAPLPAPSYNEAEVGDKPAWLQKQPLLTQADQAAERSLMENRVRSLMAVDESAERLLNLLEARALLHNTYVFFLSDNGLHMGEHRLVGTKDTPYEEAIGIPMFARGPGIAAGRKTDALVLNIDLAPTVATLAGLSEALSGMDGRPLNALFQVEPSSWRKDFLVEHFAPSVAGIDAMGASAFALEYAAVHHGSGIYVDYAYGDHEYYDLQRDRYQLENRYAELFQQQRLDLESRLSQLRTCRGPLCD